MDFLFSKYRFNEELCAFSSFESEHGIVSIPSVEHSSFQTISGYLKNHSFEKYRKRRETAGGIEGQSSFIHHSIQYTYGSRTRVYLQCSASSIQPLHAGFASNRIRMSLRLFT